MSCYEPSARRYPALYRVGVVYGPMSAMSAIYRDKDNAIFPDVVEITQKDDN
ncbi:hypothetical protein K439DRAFT_1639962 [Ramaria rubella]|nr:hypothetical protein K439DRAFT_1639962 [Ramaria rubella]